MSVAVFLTAGFEPPMISPDAIQTAATRRMISAARYLDFRFQKNSMARLSLRCRTLHRLEIGAVLAQEIDHGSVDGLAQADREAFAARLPFGLVQLREVHLVLVRIGVEEIGDALR